MKRTRQEYFNSSNLKNSKPQSSTNNAEQSKMAASNGPSRSTISILGTNNLFKHYEREAAERMTIWEQSGNGIPWDEFFEHYGDRYTRSSSSSSSSSSTYLKNVNWTFVRDAAEPETPVLEEMKARITGGSQQYHVSVSATFCMVIINSTMYR